MAHRSVSPRILIVVFLGLMLVRAVVGLVLKPSDYRIARTRCGRPYLHQSITFRLSSTSDDLSSTSIRRAILLEKLALLSIDANGLDEAATVSLQDPTKGYDGSFGKSAIRTYRSFLYPKKEDNVDADQDRMVAAAVRCANQIDFLLKRHRSHLAEWVRHHDAAEPTARQTFPMIVVLDNVRSAFNVGSIFRTADAAGCAQVITTGITPHPFGSGAEKLNKSALGAELVVPSMHFTTTREAIQYLRTELPQYELIGMETTSQSMPYAQYKYSKDGAAFVLGNEVTGVDTEILTELDQIVEIPMFGAKNSLNIAACVPVVLYEVIRQWGAD